MIDLFDLPRARTSDPLTSQAAARKAARWIPSHQDQILGVLWRGMTPVEIGKLTGLSVVQVDRRRKELVESNLVRLEGERDGYQIWHRVMP